MLKGLRSGCIRMGCCDTTHGKPLMCKAVVRERIQIPFSQ